MTLQHILFFTSYLQNLMQLPTVGSYLRILWVITSVQKLHHVFRQNLQVFYTTVCNIFNDEQHSIFDRAAPRWSYQQDTYFRKLSNKLYLICDKVLMLHILMQTIQFLPQNFGCTFIICPSSNPFCCQNDFQSWGSHINL